MSSKQNMIRAVKGVKDIMPVSAPAWRFVEDTALDIFSLYNYAEIRVPIFEKTGVFKKSLGETTDIVEKEMYTFTDRGGESLTLRPEGTASVVRAFVEHKMYNMASPVKLFYMGPMFRAERPQAGRFRQFHQIGAEAFGAHDPAVDSELIIMLTDFFNALQLPGLKVRLNSLGCHECRPSFRDALYDFLNERKDSLCQSCQSRIERNPLRALDCKSPDCAEIVRSAPTIDKFRCKSCEDHLDKVRRPLMELEIPIVLDVTLVRGIDYYTKTVFEVISENLGAQNAVAAGGRYDRLVESFGGPPTPAIGFACGIERIISLLDKILLDKIGIEDLYEGPPDIFIVPLTDLAGMKVIEIASSLRSSGYSVERSFDGGSVKSQMKRANRSGAKFAIIIGEDEMENGVATIKDMESGEQIQPFFSDLLPTIDNEFDNII